MKTKFNVGDVLIRSAYKEEKSKVLRDEMTVIDIISDGHPICPQVWYITRNFRGKIQNGLKKVVEDAFEKVF